MKSKLVMALAGAVLLASLSFPSNAEDAPPAGSEPQHEGVAGIETQGGELADIGGTSLPEMPQTDGEPPVVDAYFSNQTESADKTATRSGRLDMDPLTEEAISSQYRQYLEAKKNSQPLTYDIQPHVGAPYEAGKASADNRRTTLMNLNLYRLVAGLTPLEESAELSDAAQHGAVVLAAINQLTHYPEQPQDMDDDFFKIASGATASSNLSAGYSRMEDGVDGCMRDNSGFNLTCVGHRRWFLNPELLYVGLGQAESPEGSQGYNRYYDYKVFDRSNVPLDYNFISWPSSGNFPMEMAQNKIPWSISLNPLRYGTPDREAVTVEITNPAGQTETFSRADYIDSSAPSGQNKYFNVNLGGYGRGPCIICNFGDNYAEYSRAGSYRVKVTGLKSASTGEEVSLDYEVNMFCTNPVKSVEFYYDTERIHPGDDHYYVGYTYWAQTTISPLDATIQGLTWHSSDEQVATVNSYGQMKVVGEGTVTITATAYNGISCSVTVNTEVRCRSIAAKEPRQTINVGEATKCEVIFTPENTTNKELIWTSNDTSVATVDGSGTVTGVKAGSAIIAAETRQGGKRTSWMIQVVEKQPTPTPSPAPTPTPSPSPSPAPTPTPSPAPSPSPAPTPGPNPTPSPSPAPSPAPSPSPAPDRPESDPVRNFVSRMYTVALGRAAEEAGLNDWTSRLLNHEVDGAGIADGFIMSDEFKNKNVPDRDYVDILYRTFFDREADEGGRTTWMEALAAGSARAYVLAGFVNSVEFDNLCAEYGIARGEMRENGEPINPGIRRFVERCYLKVLGREGEKAGVDDWIGWIVRGEQTPESAAKLFFFSDEYLNKHTSDEKFVETLYQTFMDRASDPVGKADWMGHLAGGMSREEVLEGFSRSVEFAAIMESFGL